MNTGNKSHRRIVAFLAAVSLVTLAGPFLAHDRVNEICIYGGQISYCAPDGR